MALDGNQKPRIDGVQTKPIKHETAEVARAKMDEMLLEALAALEHARTLHETSPNPETKRHAKRILDSLHSSLLQLAPLGVYSAQRLERMSVTL
jgi:hypothetical protein